jgi:enoyl-CoA hydratase/carnithine racemase
VSRPRITRELAAGAAILTVGSDAVQLDSDFVVELTAALEDADLDPDVFLILIRHEGEVLSLGCSEEALADAESLARVHASLSGLIALARRIPKLIVVELAGRVEAEGLLLLRLGEVTLATGDSTLRPGDPARIPAELLAITGADARRSLAVLLAGRDLTATEGAEIGLVTGVVQSGQLGSARAELLARVRMAGPTAIARLKRMLWEASRGSAPRSSG